MNTFEPPTASPEPGGQVVLLAPVPCGALSITSSPETLCDPESLASGSRGADVFTALMLFDLRGLPAGAEVLYAALELAGLDDAFTADVGDWTLRAVDLPAGARPETLSLARVIGAPPLEPAIGWRLGRADLGPGRRNTLRFEPEALALLAQRIGRATLAFRIDGPGRGGGLFAWHGRGPEAPRLRVAYTPAEPVAATPAPLILWNDAPAP